MLAECSSSVMHPILNGFVKKKPCNYHMSSQKGKQEN